MVSPQTLITGGLMVLASAGSAQTTPAPLVESVFPKSFLSISQLRVLSTGDLLVHAAVPAADNPLRLTKLHVAHWADGTITEVPGWGRGPMDYGHVATLIGAHGDTTWIVDGARWRLLKLGRPPELRPVDTLPFPRGADGRPRFTPVEGDTLGYFYDIKTERGDLRGALQDSGAVRRWRAMTGVADTIAWLQWRTWYVDSPGMPLILPFQSLDDWAVAPDGELVIARADSYRVERITPSGRLARGPAIPYQRQVVTAADRAAFVRDNRTESRSVGLPDWSERYATAPWPTHKPPFSGRITLAPDGTVWVPTTPVREADSLVYDVIDRDGTLRTKVVMPRGTRIVAFGPRAMYTTRWDGRAVHLERRSWSPAP